MDMILQESLLSEEKCIKILAKYFLARKHPIIASKHLENTKIYLLNNICIYSLLSSSFLK